MCNKYFYKINNCQKGIHSVLPMINFDNSMPLKTDSFFNSPIMDIG